MPGVENTDGLLSYLGVVAPDADVVISGGVPFEANCLGDARQTERPKARGGADMSDSWRF